MTKTYRNALGLFASLASFVAIAALVLATSACGSGGYCQSGPYHGTQCYSSTEAIGGGVPPAPPPGSLLNPNEVHPPAPTRYHTTPADGGVTWSR